MAVAPGPVREAILRFKVDFASVEADLAKLRRMVADASRVVIAPGAAAARGVGAPAGAGVAGAAGVMGASATRAAEQQWRSSATAAQSYGRAVSAIGANVQEVSQRAGQAQRALQSMYTARLRLAQGLRIVERAPISDVQRQVRSHNLLNRALARGVIDTGRFRSETARLAPQIDKITAAANRTGSALGRFSRQIVRHLGWIASAIVLYGTWRAAATAMREAISTQQQLAMARVYQPQLDWSPETLKKIAVFTRAYGGDMSAASESAALWAKKTGDLNSALYLTGEALKFQRATGQQLEQTYRSGIALASQLGLSLRDVPELWNTIAAAALRTGGSVRQFREDAAKDLGLTGAKATSMAEEISKALGQSSAALRTLGFTGAQQVAIVAALAERLDANFRMVGERLPRMLEAFRDPKLVQWMRDVGIQVELSSDGLTRMAAAYDRLGTAEKADLASKMGNRREYQIALNFLAAWTDALKLADEISKDKTATDRLAAANLATLGGRIDTVKASWEAMTTILLTRALPGLTAVAGVVADGLIPALGKVLTALSEQPGAWAAVAAAMAAVLPWSRMLTISLGTNIPAAFGLASVSAGIFAATMVARMAIAVAAVLAVMAAVEAVKVALAPEAIAAERAGRAAAWAADPSIAWVIEATPETRRAAEKRIATFVTATNAAVRAAAKDAGELGKQLAAAGEAQTDEFFRAQAKAVARGGMTLEQQLHYYRATQKLLAEAKAAGGASKALEEAEALMRLMQRAGKFPTLKPGPAGSLPDAAAAAAATQREYEQALRQYDRFIERIQKQTKTPFELLHIGLARDIPAFGAAMEKLGFPVAYIADMLRRFEEAQTEAFDEEQAQRYFAAMAPGIEAWRQLAEVAKDAGDFAEAARLRDLAFRESQSVTAEQWAAALVKAGQTPEEAQRLTSEWSKAARAGFDIGERRGVSEREIGWLRLRGEHYGRLLATAEAVGTIEQRNAARAQQQAIERIIFEREAEQAIKGSGIALEEVMKIYDQRAAAEDRVRRARETEQRQQTIWAAGGAWEQAQRQREDAERRASQTAARLYAAVTGAPERARIEADLNAKLDDLFVERQRIIGDFDLWLLKRQRTPLETVPLAMRGEWPYGEEFRLRRGQMGEDLARVNAEIRLTNMEAAQSYADTWLRAFDQISDRWSQTVVENIGKGRSMAEAMLDLYRGMGAEFLQAQFKRLPAFRQMMGRITDAEMRGRGMPVHAEIERMVTTVTGASGGAVVVSAHTQAMERHTAALTTTSITGAQVPAPLQATGRMMERFTVSSSNSLAEQARRSGQTVQSVSGLATETRKGREAEARQNVRVGQYLQGISAAMALEQAGRQGDWLGGASAGSALGSLFAGSAFGVGFGPIGAVVGGLFGLFGGGGEPEKQPEQLGRVRPELWRRGDVNWALPVRAPESAYYGGRAGMVLDQPVDQHSEIHLHGDIVLPNARDGRTLERELRQIGETYSSERSRGVGRNLPAVR